MLSTAVNQRCPVLCSWAVEQTRAHNGSICVCSCKSVCSAIIGSAGHSMLTRGTGVHTKSTRYDTQTHAVVSPAAAQLIQALTTISSPSASPAPHPRGSHSVAGHSHPRLWAESQQLRLRLGDVWRAEGEIWEEGKKKGECEEARERGKGGREVCGGHLSHSLSYTKVPSVPVIRAAEAGLRAEE